MAHTQDDEAERITPEGFEVRVYGTAGIVTGTAGMAIQVRGQEASFRIRYTAVYIKAGRPLADRRLEQSTRLP